MKTYIKHSLILLAMLLGCGSILAQEDVPFNGIITDAVKQPLKGAKIWVKKNHVATSDKEGKFGLTNVSPLDTLHIRYRRTNYLIPVEGRKSIRIFLGDQLNVSEDDELANMGYNFVKKREKLIPSNGISGEDLVRTGQTDILQALVGLVPGYNLVNGTPEIRGKNSLTLSNEPLYILDGVVVPSLSGVNIYDVDHVEVLKDASIYGSRGANGAIIVTTRRG